MHLDFVPVSLEKKFDYLELFAACPQKASDYSVVNLWGWAEAYGLFWAWAKDLVWIKQTKPEELYWGPVGSWEDVAWGQSFDELINGIWQILNLEHCKA